MKCHVAYCVRPKCPFLVVSSMWWLFLPHVRILGKCSTIHSPPSLFFLLCLKAEIRSRTLILLLRPGSVRVFPDELRVSSFPDRFPLCQHGGIVSPLRIRWVMDVCVCRCNLPSALLAEWSGSFMCHCSNTGVERTPNKSQSRSVWTNIKYCQSGQITYFLRSSLCMDEITVYH